MKKVLNHFMRPCNRCGKMFKPLGKHCRICINCDTRLGINWRKNRKEVKK